MKIHNRYNWRPLADDDAHVFFGYYDRCPWNADNTKHLALRVDQCERVPRPGETADVGYVTREDDGFVKVAETRAWCHQQGAMTLWLKHIPNAFIYNDYDPQTRRLVARIHSLNEEGPLGHYDRPVYAISPDGRWGVSLNFARIPRRGYTYADATLPEALHPDLDEDGIFLMDLHSGESRLLVTYRQIVDQHPVPYELDDVYWWLNHAIFNADSTRLLFLFRHRRAGHPDAGWKTHMYTVGIDGADPACPLPDFYWANGLISHQIWGRHPHEILIDPNWRGQGHEYVVFDERERPIRAMRLSRGMGPMAHLVFSTDGRRLLADTYPVEGVQSLALVDAATGECRVIGRFRHEQPADSPKDVRCDLHPRWSADGATVTVDSIHNGKRSIYMLEPNA